MTPRINAFGWAFLGALALGTFALAASGPSGESRQSQGLPQTKRLRHELGAGGLVRGSIDGQSVAGTNVPLARARAYSTLLQTEFAKRREALPSDASQYIDEYSAELYPMPTWIFKRPDQLTVTDIAAHNYRLTDEYGRPKPGHVGFGGGIDDAFKRLLTNPLAQALLSAGAFALGGPAGLAAYGAFNAYVIRGEELTAQSVALTAARTYAVSQCGVACGTAFDIGVGVASGDSVDEAATNAILGQMTPEERLAYDEGRKVYQELT